MKGNIIGTPSVVITTANALDIVFLTSSLDELKSSLIAYIIN